MSSLRRIAPIVALAAAVLALTACGGSGSDEASNDGGTVATTEGSAGERPPLDPNKTYTVTMDTSEGTFSFALDVKTSPNTTASFASLVKKGFFDGLTFHRIVPDFVIQGGDPNGDGSGGPGYTVVDVPPKDAKYTKGVVAMAKTQTEPPGTSGSQFFVVTADDAGLPPDYAILGKVTDGLDVVEKIGAIPADPSTGVPSKTVTIRKATIAES
jgi:cyclophilin family peptidyl-prolyl cis-trans isomerase